MTFLRYTVTLRHDGGRVRITTAASSMEAATAMVLRAEHAPASAVLGVALAADRVYTDRRGVRYVAPHGQAPASFRDPVTCGACHRTWDDANVTSVTPAPSARCPFEHWHRGPA